MVLDQMRVQSCCSLVICKQPRTVNTSATAEIRNASDSKTERAQQKKRRKQHKCTCLFLCHFVERIHRRRKAMGFLAPADREALNDDARRDIGLQKAGVERSLMMPAASDIGLNYVADASAVGSDHGKSNKRTQVGRFCSILLLLLFFFFGGCSCQQWEAVAIPEDIQIFDVRAARLDPTQNPNSSRNCPSKPRARRLEDDLDMPRWTYRISPGTSTATEVTNFRYLIATGGEQI